MEKNKMAAGIWLKKAKDHLTFAKAGWKESKIVSDTCVLLLLFITLIDIRLKSLWS